MDERDLREVLARLAESAPDTEAIPAQVQRRATTIRSRRRWYSLGAVAAAVVVVAGVSGGLAGVGHSSPSPATVPSPVSASSATRSDGAGSTRSAATLTASTGITPTGQSAGVKAPSAEGRSTGQRSPTGQESFAAESNQAPSCTSEQLLLDHRGLNAGAGNSYAVFIVTNGSDIACSIGGVPHLTVTTPSGRPLYTPIQSPAVQDTSEHATTVGLAPGAKGSFWVDFHTCPGAYGTIVNGELHVTFDGVSGSLTMPWSTYSACAAERIEVAAVVPGVITSAPGFSTGGSSPTAGTPPTKPMPSH